MYSDPLLSTAMSPWGWSFAHLDSGYSDIHLCRASETLSGVFLYLYGKVSHQNDATFLELMYYKIHKQLSAQKEWSALSSGPWNVWLPDWITVYFFLNMFLNETESKKLF